MRKYGRVDANQEQVVSALRAAGASVQSLSSVGEGCPDLLVGHLGRTVLMEVKDGNKPPSQRRLTDEQLKWHCEWRGDTLCIVDSPESALRALRVIPSISNDGKPAE